MKNKWVIAVDRVANAFEIILAILLLAVVSIKTFDAGLEIMGVNMKILEMEFNSVLSIAFSLVIGIEFIKMLCKHTPETVIDVLLFAIARYLVLYSEDSVSRTLSVISIAILFIVKRFVIDENYRAFKKKKDKELLNSSTAADISPKSK